MNVDIQGKNEIKERRNIRLKIKAKLKRRRRE
jgi:hypothetical protein